MGCVKNKWSCIVQKKLRLHSLCQIAYPPCLWAAGWMSAAPSFSGLAACWSSSSWNRGSQQQSSSLLCHSGSAGDIPWKTCKKRVVQNAWGTLSCTRTSCSGYMLVYNILVFQPTASYLDHQKQYDIEQSGRSKSRQRLWCQCVKRVHFSKWSVCVSPGQVRSQ